MKLVRILSSTINHTHARETQIKHMRVWTLACFIDLGERTVSKRAHMNAGLDETTDHRSATGMHID